MRKTILFLAFLIFALIGYNQNYFPFVDTNSVWNITWNCYKPPPYPCYSDYYKYRISGDTMYSDTLYKRLFRIDMNQECSSIIEDSIYMGGIREDVSNKKVYFIQDTFFGEYLLFDFSLEVGDTVPYSFNNYGYPEIYVSSIDSILCTDGYRKRFIYSRDTWEDIVVIEGIGANTGLLEPMEIFEHVANMRCFYNNGSMVHMDPNVNSCNLEMDTCISTFVNEKNLQSEIIKIYPNPFTKKAKIKITNIRDNIHDYSFYIIDVNGKTKLKSTISSEETVIESKDFAPGLYFCIVNYRSQKIYSEIIIIK